MDTKITKKLKDFLEIKSPSDEQIKDAALVLLRINPAKERPLYNSVMKRPQAYLEWVQTEAKKFYDIRTHGMEVFEVAAFNKKALADSAESLSKVPEEVAKELGKVPELNILGKRQDHDTLPESIQAIWEKNSDRWRKMRSLRAQLQIMVSQPNYQPCDGEELAYQLKQLDTALRNDYSIYDNFDASKGNSKPDSIDGYTDNVKTVQNARTQINRLLKKEELSEKELLSLQDAVNTLVALKQSFKPVTIERLKKAGVAIPETA